MGVGGREWWGWVGGRGWWGVGGLVGSQRWAKAFIKTQTAVVCVQ